jgi:hypothetical protein
MSKIICETVALWRGSPLTVSDRASLETSPISSAVTIQAPSGRTVSSD